MIITLFYLGSTAELVQLVNVFVSHTVHLDQWYNWIIIIYGKRPKIEV